MYERAVQSTPRGLRPHIVLLGRCNAGKSALLNALTGHDLAIVSSQRGTTTDPVTKASELLPFGRWCMLIRRGWTMRVNWVTVVPPRRGV